jgi:hypothetical protein
MTCFAVASLSGKIGIEPYVICCKHKRYAMIYVVSSDFRTRRKCLNGLAIHIDMLRFM